MKIPEEIVERVRNQADIIDIVGQHITLRRAGANYKGLCPFHDEKTPSLIVSPDRQIYKCFGCGAGGNVFSFMMDYHSITFPEAVEALARQLGIPIQKNYRDSYSGDNKKAQAIKALETVAELYLKNLNKSDGKKALDYFLNRGYTKKTIKEYLLGYSPDAWEATLNELRRKGFTYECLLDAGLVRKKSSGGYYDYFRGRAMFAIKDFLGRVIGFGARTMEKDAKTAKYINSPQSVVYDKSIALYGIFEAKNEIRDKNAAIIVEGYADVLTLHQAGIKNVIASSGTALTEGQLKLIARLTQSLFLVYDGDEAGMKAVDRALPNILKAGFDAKIILLPKGDDPDSYVKNHGKDEFLKLLEGALDFVEFKIKYSKEKLSSISGKSEIAREIIKLIALLPDRLQHDFYINKMEHPIGLSRKQIDDIYNEKEKILVKSEEKSPQKALSSQKLIAKLKPEEKKLLQIALLGPSELDIMLQAHEISIDTFSTAMAKRIFEIILDHSDRDNFVEAILDDDEINETGKQVISELAIEKETVSRNFEKIGIEISEPEIDKSISHCKLRLELNELKKKKAEFDNRLRSKLSPDEEIELLKELDIVKRRKDEIIIELGQKGL